MLTPKILHVVAPAAITFEILQGSKLTVASSKIAT